MATPTHVTVTAAMSETRPVLKQLQPRLPLKQQQQILSFL
jgi:hypothetical protein